MTHELRRKILLATSNQGKIKEYHAMLAPLGLAVEGLAKHPRVQLPEEDGSTFAENARLKAVAAARQAGLVALADDSGLCVDALGGEPGIRSARYRGGESDAERRRLLREALLGVPEERRAAHFVCAIAVASPEGEARWVQGRADGLILAEERGDGGFGYDPLFLVPELGRTYAELPAGEKDRISHRGKAAARLPLLLDGWPELWLRKKG
ncbi:MAG: RdgB/HAM1 family non-canonical purine NTP pyrophosphatase [Deltaproteobacteria bacterium]|nr:RdgB/HAM1 family non-canonical purine NTP pyrophosphatase [Deltaproteobacteria bacterium]